MSTNPDGGAPAERRRNPRFACDLAADTIVDGLEPSPSHCVDISMGGICVTGERVVAAGTPVRIAVRAVWAGAETDTLALDGVAVWCARLPDATHQLGVRFSETMDQAVVRRLEVLIELLAGRLQVPS